MKRYIVKREGKYRFVYDKRLKIRVSNLQSSPKATEICKQLARWFNTEYHKIGKETQV